jgi:hypothetical protein
MNIVVKDRRDLFAVGHDGDEQLRPGLASRFRCVACDHIDAVEAFSPHRGDPIVCPSCGAGRVNLAFTVTDPDAWEASLRG